MKELGILIKLNKRHLDEKRRELVALENTKKLMEDKVISLRNELHKEQEIAAKEHEIAYTYLDYATRINENIKKIIIEIIDVSQKIEAKRDEIYEAYIELKKYEVSLERLIEEEKIKESKKEDNFLNEVALSNFNQQNS